MLYEAIPTEYKGIKFKSKSEAIVARGFDLAGVLWEYEPELYDHYGDSLFKDKYKPDFLVCRYEINDYCKNHINILYIEYKPAKPTQAYLSLLVKREEKIRKVNTNSGVILLVGSPFNDLKAGCYFPGNHIDWDSPFDGENEEWDLSYLYSHWDEAKKYRFDLSV